MSLLSWVLMYFKDRPGQLQQCALVSAEYCLVCWLLWMGLYRGFDDGGGVVASEVFGPHRCCGAGEVWFEPLLRRSQEIGQADSCQCCHPRELCPRGVDNASFPGIHPCHGYTERFLYPVAVEPGLVESDREPPWSQHPGVPVVEGLWVALGELVRVHCADAFTPTFTASGDARWTS